MSMSKVRVRASGKVNICLHVGPEGEDGYHELATVFQAVSIYDYVTLGDAPKGRITVSVVGSQQDAVPVDGRNLARVAVERIARGVRINMGVHIEIEKNIPVAGGMAGGSADAAAALLGLDQFWILRMNLPDLLSYATGIGADVPFCITGGTAIGLRRGDRVASVLTRGQYHWVLALAEESLATPMVFREFDRLFPNPKPPKVDDGLLAALSVGDVRRVAQFLHNDLQPAALSLLPKLEKVLDVGTEAGALGGLVSGSGPTCAFLAESEAEARIVEEALVASRLCREVRRTTGPAKGATVVY